MREQFARGLAICGAFGSSVVVSACGTPPVDQVEGRVERVIDGDTIVVAGLGTVRYIGVDTPELHHPRQPVQRMADAAWNANRALVEGKVVRVVFEAERRDVHGRALGDVYLGRRFVNAELVRQGFGRTLAIRPNIDHAGELARLEQAARRARRGIWGPDEGGVPWGRP